MAFCGNCGTQIADNATVCSNCGRPVTPVVGAPPATYSAPAAGTMPLDENIAGMLAYFTIIPAIVFLLVDPFNRNRFVRFHSFQSIFAHIAWIIVCIALSIVSSILHFIPVIGWMITAILWPLIGLAVLIIWVLLVVKAFQHQIYKLPVVGDLAEKQAGA